MISVSIIIVNWNTRELLRYCLESVTKFNAAGLTLSVIIVDNASCDDSQEMIRTEFPDLILLQMDSNIGFAKANNIALKYLFDRNAEGDYILFLNSDVIMPAGSLLNILHVLEDDDRIAAAGPALILPDGTYQVGAAGYRYGVITMFIYSFFLHKLLPMKIARGIYIDQRRYRGTLKPVFVDWISGACFCIRAQSCKDAGYWDESNFMYAEDIEYCERMRKQGSGIAYLPRIQVVHHQGASSKNDKTPNSRWVCAMLRYLKSSRTAFRYFLMRVLFAFGVVIRMGLHLVAYLMTGRGASKHKLRELWSFFKAALTCKVSS